jgi:hypothetical protein
MESFSRRSSLGTPLAVGMYIDADKGKSPPAWRGLSPTSDRAPLVKGDLEAAPIGWQLFVLESGKSDSIAFLLLLATYATRLLAQALSIAIRPSHPLIRVRHLSFQPRSQGTFTDISVYSNGDLVLADCPFRRARQVGLRGLKGKSEPTEVSALAPDIQAVITVLRRRTRSFGHGETELLDLRETNLSGAKSLIQAQLGGTIGDENTRLPSDLKPPRIGTPSRVG